MGEFQIFKISYTWYEGEHRETLLAKSVSAEAFEQDLIQAKQFAQSMFDKKINGGDYLGKGYSVQCLPEYYGQIIWFLVKKNVHRKYGVIQQIYVSKPYRNRGLGKLLLRKAEKRLAKKVKTIRLSVTLGNCAINLYESCGFAKKRLIMEKSIR